MIRPSLTRMSWQADTSSLRPSCSAVASHGNDVLIADADVQEAGSKAPAGARPELREKVVADGRPAAMGACEGGPGAMGYPVDLHSQVRVPAHPGYPGDLPARRGHALDRGQGMGTSLLINVTVVPWALRLTRVSAVQALITVRPWPLRLA
jgi:hypothetical protein